MNEGQTDRGIARIGWNLKITSSLNRRYQGQGHWEVPESAKTLKWMLFEGQPMFKVNILF